MSSRVTLNPAGVAGLIVDNLEVIARFTGKPTGDTTTIAVATTDLVRSFTIRLTREGVVFTPAAEALTADLALPAEAFARLVYRRLDAAHTPPGVEGSALHTLRRVFPGP